MIMSWSIPTMSRCRFTIIVIVAVTFVLMRDAVGMKNRHETYGKDTYIATHTHPHTRARTHSHSHPVKTVQKTIQTSALPALAWEDCGLSTDIPLIQLTAYTHTPDPIVYGANSSIYKQWKILRSLPTGSSGREGENGVYNLTEHVTVARQNSTGHWEVHTCTHTLQFVRCHY